LPWLAHAYRGGAPIRLAMIRLMLLRLTR
jgi:hypothetical protein